MKKANFAISIIVSIMLLAPAGFGFAQSSVDLGSEGTGLLPSNPFYFLKEWGREFRKFITFNAVKKTELELGVLNEKAAELKKLEEIAPNNTEALNTALDTYEFAIDQLKIRLDSLKETSSNPNVDRLLTQLVESSLKHQRLFDELQTKFPNEENLRKGVEVVKEKLANTLAAVAEKLDSSGKFQQRFQSAVAAETDELKELRAAELVDRVEEKLSSENAKKFTSVLKDDLLIKFSGRLQGLELTQPGISQSILEQISGEQLRVLKLLDEIREKVQNPDLKSQLNVIRQKVLNRAEENNGIGSEEARKVIEDARILITDLENKISSRGATVRASVKELLDRAKFNLTQAEKLFDEENYGGAFGQATAAYAAAKNALGQLMPDVSDNNKTLEVVKNYYDSLVARARTANLTKEQSPKVFELLSEAEKKIVELTKLIETKASQETIAVSLRSIKLILAAVGQLIESVISQ